MYLVHKLKTKHRPFRKATLLKYLLFSCGTIAQPGPRPPECQGF